ncbi:tripartite tricarboxylate transporter TctB family protein [Solidesulfovibrio sp. C21]|uniref:tripartite tricarboxylate transporter TctB family protein n=1 Tax=Solidesulfovibrio sp. C21 TaxID=3398613 RepID=UPI0039FD350B
MTRKYADFLSGLGFLAIALLFWSAGRDLTGISRIFPTILELFLGLGGLGLLLNSLRKSLGGTSCEEMPVWGRVWLILACSIVYVICVPLLGFYVASLLFLFLVAMVLGGHWDWKHAKIAALFSVGLCVLVYLVFKLLLSVPTPKGLFI